MRPVLSGNRAVEHLEELQHPNRSFNMDSEMRDEGILGFFRWKVLLPAFAQAGRGNQHAPLGQQGHGDPRESLVGHYVRAGLENVEKP